MKNSPLLISLILVAVFIFTGCTGSSAPYDEYGEPRDYDSEVRDACSDAGYLDEAYDEGFEDGKEDMREAISSDPEYYLDDLSYYCEDSCEDYYNEGYDEGCYDCSY